MKKFFFLMLLMICRMGYSQTEPGMYSVTTHDGTEKVIEVFKITADKIFYWDDNGKKAFYLKSELKSVKTSTGAKIETIAPENKVKEYIKKPNDVLENSNISQSDYSYCQIVGTQKLLSLKVTIQIDYGQERKWGTDTRIRDDNGKVQAFNSMIDALNYMGSQGWEFIQAYVVTAGSQNVYHYMLKRKM